MHGWIDFCLREQIHCNDGEHKYKKQHKRSDIKEARQSHHKCCDYLLEHFHAANKFKKPKDAEAAKDL